MFSFNPPALYFWDKSHQPSLNRMMVGTQNQSRAVGKFRFLCLISKHDLSVDAVHSLVITSTILFRFLCSIKNYNLEVLSRYLPHGAETSTDLSKLLCLHFFSLNF